jgi:SAM-dependent methyltransferase
MDEFRCLVGRIRYKFMRNKLQTFDTSKVECIDNTVPYNLTALSHISTDFSMRRMKWLIHGTLASELVDPDSKFLFVGPRTENELLFLKGLGYKNVTGLDLISYSPWVKVGDMHNMPFETNSFDVVICGWTIPYSTDCYKLVQEMARVCRSGGVLSVGFQHTVANAPEIPTTNGARLSGASVNSIGDLTKLLAGMKHCDVQPILQYDALLADHTAEKQLEKTGLASSQVLFVGKIDKHP